METEHTIDDATTDESSSIASATMPGPSRSIYARMRGPVLGGLLGLLTLFTVHSKPGLERPAYAAVPDSVRIHSFLQLAKDPAEKEALSNGYIPGETDRNWRRALEKTGDEILRERIELGIEEYGRLLGIEPGKVPEPQVRDSLMRAKWPLIEKHAKAYGLDPFQLGGVLLLESGGESRTLSPTGGLGIGQLTMYGYGEATWSDSKYRPAINPFVDDEAIERVADQLAHMRKMYKDAVLGLTAYNAGEPLMNEARRFAIDSLGEGSSAVIHAMGPDSTHVLTAENRNYASRVLKRQAYLVPLMQLADGVPKAGRR